MGQEEDMQVYVFSLIFKGIIENFRMKIAGSINYCVILNLLVRRIKTKENHMKWESENITLKRKKKVW